MRQFISVMLLCGLAACTDVPAQAVPLPVPPPAEDTCNANSYRELIGMNGTALERVRLLGQVRIIRPRMRVTMDFRPNRINFKIGDNGRLEAVYCG